MPCKDVQGMDRAVRRGVRAPACAARPVAPAFESPNTAERKRDRFRTGVLQSRLHEGPRGHRLETPRRAVPLRPGRRVAEGEVPSGAGVRNRGIHGARGLASLSRRSPPRRLRHERKTRARRSAREGARPGRQGSFEGASRRPSRLFSATSSPVRDARASTDSTGRSTVIPFSKFSRMRGAMYDARVTAGVL